LSSIEPDTHRVGFEAAQTLAAMLCGEPVTDDRRLIPPRGLVVRKSTDIIVTADRASAEALRLIREQASSGVSIGEILAPLEVSRSTLERRFRELFGRSPKAELDRVRMERAKELLLQTDLTLPAIAQQTGFQHVETFHRHFRHWAGQSPAQFRRSHRLR
jgi:LacI family transcriptional regulator